MFSSRKSHCSTASRQGVAVQGQCKAAYFETGFSLHRLKG
jgi:hypothetical protein